MAEALFRSPSLARLLDPRHEVGLRLSGEEALLISIVCMREYICMAQALFRSPSLARLLDPRHEVGLRLPGEDALIISIVCMPEYVHGRGVFPVPQPGAPA